jgi:hypothetical protein
MGYVIAGYIAVGLIHARLMFLAGQYCNDYRLRRMFELLGRMGFTVNGLILWVVLTWPIIYLFPSRRE